jgi:hypothetical protein
MRQTDEFGMMEVEVDGRTKRRRAVLQIDRSRPIFNHPTPELRDNEILVETIGGTVTIVKTHA